MRHAYNYFQYISLNKLSLQKDVDKRQRSVGAFKHKTVNDRFFLRDLKAFSSGKIKNFFSFGALSINSIQNLCHTLVVIYFLSQ